MASEFENPHISALHDGTRVATAASELTSLKATSLISGMYWHNNFYIIKNTVTLLAKHLNASIGLSYAK